MRVQYATSCSYLTALLIFLILLFPNELRFPGIMFFWVGMPFAFYRTGDDSYEGS